MLGRFCRLSWHPLCTFERSLLSPADRARGRFSDSYPFGRERAQSIALPRLVGRCRSLAEAVRVPIVRLTMMPAAATAGGRRFHTSVAGISSSNILNYPNPNLLTQQRQFQQAFQQLGQELQTGNLSALQNTAQTTGQAELAELQRASPASANPTPPGGIPVRPILNSPQGTPKHGIHGHTPHHLVGAGDDDNDGSTADSNPLAQTLQTGNSERSAGLQRLAAGLQQVR